MSFTHLRLPYLCNSLCLFSSSSLKYQFCSARNIVPCEHSSDNDSMEDICTPTLQKRLFLKGKALRIQPEAGRKEISSGDRAQCCVSLRTVGGHPCSEGSSEPAEFKMGSTRLSQRSPSKPKEQELPPCIGLTFLLQSQTFSLALGKVGSCFLSLRHNLIFLEGLRWNRRHWGE